MDKQDADKEPSLEKRTQLIVPEFFVITANSNHQAQVGVNLNLSYLYPEVYLGSSYIESFPALVARLDNYPHPQIIFLDDVLDPKDPSWIVNYDLLEEIALSRQDTALLSKLQTLNQGKDSEAEEHLIRDLKRELSVADPLNIAIFLRLMGYQNKIILRSDSNNYPEFYQIKIKELSAFFLTRDLGRYLIDGIISLNDEEGFVVIATEHWELPRRRQTWRAEFIEGNYHEGLKALIDALLGERKPVQ